MSSRGLAIVLLALAALVIPAGLAVATPADGFSRFDVRYPNTGTTPTEDCLKVEFGDNQKADHYAWDFGDSTQVDTISSLIDHEYGTQGVYAVTVVVYDSAGQTSSNATTYFFSINTFDGQCSRMALEAGLIIPLAILTIAFGIPAITFVRKPYRKYRLFFIVAFIVSASLLVLMILLSKFVGLVG